MVAHRLGQRRSGQQGPGGEGEVIKSSVDVQTAVVLAVGVVAIALVIALRRLATWEVRTAE